MEEDYIISKEDFKNIFNSEAVISKKDYLDYIYFKEEKGA
jgi:hypothetical protein